MTGERGRRAVPAEQAPEVRVERAQPAALGRGGTGRWSMRRKREVVIRLLRGEDLESVSRETRVTAAKLSAWRDDFLAGGEAALKSRDVPDVRDVQITQLYARIGELSMAVELKDDLLGRFNARGIVPFDPRSRR